MGRTVPYTLTNPIFHWTHLELQRDFGVHDILNGTEYFRRVLCNLLGSEIENGELHNDLKWTGEVIQNICFNNAQKYFNWQPGELPVTTTNHHQS